MPELKWRVLLVLYADDDDDDDDDNSGEYLQNVQLLLWLKCVTHFYAY